MAECIRMKKIDHYEAVNGFFIVFNIISLKFLLFVLMQIRSLFHEALWTTLHNLSSTPQKTMARKKTKKPNNTDLTQANVKM